MSLRVRPQVQTLLWLVAHNSSELSIGPRALGSEALASRPIEPTYRPSGVQGEVVVYAGELDVTVGDETRAIGGELTLRLGAGPLVARFAGPATEALHFVAGHEASASVSVPTGASLMPPPATILAEWHGDADWIEAQIPIRSELAAGDAAHARRFIFHISGALDARLRPVEVASGQQARLGFRLRDWDLVIARTGDASGEHDFGFVVEATPNGPPSRADVDQLARRLFIVLSFLASREVGVVPVCGLTETGEVVWASWGSPRLRPGRPGVRWCPPHLVASALPVISEAFTRLYEQDQTMWSSLGERSSTSLPQTELRRWTFGCPWPARESRCSGGRFSSATPGLLAKMSWAKCGPLP